MIPIRIVYIKYQIFERPPKRDAHFLLWTNNKQTSRIYARERERKERERRE